MGKFCSNCGQEIKANSKFCTKCGIEIGDVKEVDTKTNSTKTSGFAVAGFVVSLCSLMIPTVGVGGIVGTVFSSIGLGKTGKGKDKGKGLAIAGLVMGIIAILAGLDQLGDFTNFYDVFDWFY